MSSTGPDAVQARLTLISCLYRETLSGATQALAIAGQPPLTADEKEIIFGEVERAVWGFEESVFENPPELPEGWLERVEDKKEVQDAVARGVRRVLDGRRGP